MLGPSDLRDGPARLVDAYTNPHQYIRNTSVKWGLYGVYLVDARAGLLPLDDTLQHVYDPYAFVRDAYLQRRAYLVSDGKVSMSPCSIPAMTPPTRTGRAARRPAGDADAAERPPGRLARHQQLLHLAQAAS